MLVVGLIDIQHMQAVIKGFFFFFFPKIATILVIWKSSDREVTVLKKVSALFQSYSKTVANPLHGNFFFFLCTLHY